MHDQSRPEQADDGQDAGNAGAEGVGPEAARNAAAQEPAAQEPAARESGKKAAGRPGSRVPAMEQAGKSRQGYLDPSGSESTREMRDTARRRRDAEEKLQQHLIEAKEHIPNERLGQQGEAGQGTSH